MNRLVLLLFVIGAVSAQRWGYNGNNNNNGNNGNWEGHSGSRRNFVPAPLAHDGRVVDTPEIAQAKAAHFAAHDAANKAAPLRSAPYTDYTNQNQNSQNSQNNYNNQNYRNNQDYDNYDDRSNNNDDYEQNNQVEKRWRGPLAKIEFTQDGKFIKETPEVAHARQQHLAALNAAKQSGGYGYEGRPSDEEFNGQYRGDEQQQYNNNNNNNNNQYNNGGRYEDDGQYRGEGSNRRTNWQGQGNQYNDRPQGNRY